MVLWNSRVSLRFANPSAYKNSRPRFNPQILELYSSTIGNYLTTRWMVFSHFTWLVNSLETMGKNLSDYAQYLHKSQITTVKNHSSGVPVHSLDDAVKVDVYYPVSSIPLHI